ncbi:MAG: EamA family transporter RarD [Rhodobacteraceae bacterium]|nr:EamA family transporter RarD [Paracoccaceae bacterium]
MSESGKGIWAMVAACVVWGLSPMYYKLLAHVPPLEVLSHRTLWALAIFALVLTMQGRVGVLVSLVTTRRSLLLVILAGLMISLNWFVFILSIQIGRAVEASLGYFIFPLVAVLLGRLVFKESLSRVKRGAVALAAMAIIILTLGLGVPPYVSLVLAFSFGFYGVIKKGLQAGPVISVTGEVLVLAPLAVIWLLGVHFGGWQGLVGRNLAIFGHDLGDSLLLALSGLLTASPLILFSYASQRLPLSAVGLLQYINPSLQFLVALLIFAEPVTSWHLIAFPLIWVALTIYSLDALSQERRARRSATRVGTSSTTLT